jgi:hypothetical protein
VRHGEGVQRGRELQRPRAHHRVRAQALAVGFAVALQPSLRRKASSAHLKQLVKKVGEEKAMTMLKGAEEGFKENYALLKKLAEM